MRFEEPVIRYYSNIADARRALNGLTRLHVALLSVASCDARHSATRRVAKAAEGRGSTLAQRISINARSLVSDAEMTRAMDLLERGLSLAEHIQGLASSEYEKDDPLTRRLIQDVASITASLLETKTSLLRERREWARTNCPSVVKSDVKKAIAACRTLGLDVGDPMTVVSGDGIGFASYVPIRNAQDAQGFTHPIRHVVLTHSRDESKWTGRMTQIQKFRDPRHFAPGMTFAVGDATAIHRCVAATLASVNLARKT